MAFFFVRVRLIQGKYSQVALLLQQMSIEKLFCFKHLFNSSQSPPALSQSNNGRLFKRTSVDSGINMDLPSVRSMFRSHKFARDFHTKLSRADRSMSLPVANSILNAFSTNPSMGATSTHDTIADCFSLSIDSALDPTSYSTANTSLSNISLLSPNRKMDFALCK